MRSERVRKEREREWDGWRLEKVARGSEVRGACG